MAAGVIEDALGCRQVDFANRYLGGGVLSGGCVQEEIRFAVSPELLFGMIVSPRMGAADAIVVRGAEQFAQTRGYARSLQYAGSFADPCARGDDGTPDVELVAIDAVDYRRFDPRAQFSQAHLLRELGKARSGFLRDARAIPVATGNWGCGVFGGDPALKAVLQWLAASAEGRALHYFSFRDPRIGDLAAFVATAQKRVGTVGELFQRLLMNCEPGGTELYERLLRAATIVPKWIP
jgi:poly(ADP-ribose) glycohydrolase